MEYAKRSEWFIKNIIFDSPLEIRKHSCFINANLMIHLQYETPVLEYCIIHGDVQRL